ncbi:MAG: hypothetical protein AB8E82_18945 [Aureispira sp.]
MEKYTFGNLIVFFREENIIEVEQIHDWKGGDLEGAQQAVEGLKVFVQNSKELNGILIHSPSLYQSKEVMNCYQQADLQEAAKAILVKSFTQRLIGNVYMKFVKGQPNESGRIVPSKLFTDEEKAMDWLREQLKQI